MRPHTHRDAAPVAAASAGAHTTRGERLSPPTAVLIIGPIHVLLALFRDMVTPERRLSCRQGHKAVPMKGCMTLEEEELEWSKAWRRTKR